MSKRISAKILLSVLVAFSATFFILKIPVKADTVQPYTFVYSEKHIYEQRANSISASYIHQLEIFISANHEVSGYYSLAIMLPENISTSTVTNTKNYTIWAEGGQVDIVDDTDGNGILWADIFVTGQKDVKVTIRQISNNEIVIFKADNVGFVNQDQNGNTVVDNVSLYSRVDQMVDSLQQIQTAVQNISDVNELDFTTYVPRSFGAGTDNINFTNTDILTNVKDIYVKISPSMQEKPAIYRIETGISNNNYLASVNVVKVLGFENSTYGNWEPKYYVDRSGRNVVIYIYDQLLLGNNDTRYIVIHFNGEPYYLRYRNNLFKMSYITDDSIQYWDLLKYFQDYAYQQEQLKNNSTIISHLWSIMSAVTGNSRSHESVQNNDEVTEQLQTQTDQYHNIESTFQSSFSTEQTQIQEQLSVNPMTSFSKTALWFTDQLTNLYNRSGNFKILFTLPLILGLAMYFIGRGRKVAAPNTVEHYTLVESGEAGEGRTVYKTTRSTARRRAFRDRSKT